MFRQHNQCNGTTVLLIEFHGAGTNQGATGTGGLQLEPQVSQDAAQVEPGEPGQAGEQHKDLSRFLGDQTQVLDQTRDL